MESLFRIKCGLEGKAQKQTKQRRIERMPLQEEMIL